MKNIAIVTGASSGMGKDFANTVQYNIDVDELWIIARRKENLEKLKKKIRIPVKVLALDLSKEESFDKLKKLYKEEKVNIKLLVNASGYGKFDKTTEVSLKDSMGMIDLNISALTKMCLISLPHMKEGSSIINFASVAAFQPVPWINIYAATKAYVLRFSRALNKELKNDKIHVMAVCPFWTKTEFFDRAVSKNEVVKKYVAMYKSSKIVKRAWRDLRRKKDVSKFGFIARGQVFLSKILPHKLIMYIWCKQQKLK